MTLGAISIRNLLRRKGKAAFVLAGLVIGVATVVGIISFVDTMTADINTKLEKYGANILIVPRTENLSLTYGGLSLGGVSFEMQEIQAAELQRVSMIKNAKNIAAIGPLLLGVIDVRERKVLLAGVDFEAARILKPWWRLIGDLPDEKGAVVGAEAARQLGLKISDSLSVKGHELEVSAVLAPTGSQDDQLIFARLATAQTILNKPGRVSMAEVAALCKDCPIEEMVVQISAALPGANVMAIQQVVETRMETLAQFKKFSFAISGVILLIGSLTVLVTMMSSVRERTDEIGIFRAIGFRRRHVMSIVFMEAALVSSLAGVWGYFAGLAAAQLALQFFGENASTVIFSPLLGVGAFGTALALGLIASAYPAFLASRMDPSEALRAL
jgi:putative ABC transport system permease protein